MNRSRFTEEQIVDILKEQEVGGGRLQHRQVALGPGIPNPSGLRRQIQRNGAAPRGVILPKALLTAG